MESIKKLTIGKNHLWFLRDGQGSHGSESARAEQVENSLKDRFVFAGEKEGRDGLRAPQLGALHAILAHRSMESDEPITIVMPTGTGKTETMLAAFCQSPMPTLVLVPSDALRTQIAGKFVTLGRLPEFGVVAGEFLTPVVAVVSSALTSIEQVDELIGVANVMVATPQALAGFTTAARERLVELCGRLFVDEAHHIAAKTWSAVSELFARKEIIQFTATPYREDGKHLSGKIAYAYPLRLAQENGYFSRINYHSIIDLENPDRAVAIAAVAQLRADLALNLDHVLMARVSSKKRSQELIKLYEEVAADMKPVRIDSDLTATSKKKRLEQLESREIRIIVCVDMLGEGFDLSALKIAAIHDPQKSLAVTLQFVGRFTRVGGENLGEASAFVPLQVAGIDDRLRKLYGEDADWNTVIRDLTERAVGHEKARSEFEGEFKALPTEVAMRSIHPKMSTVTYRVALLEWNPEAIYDLFADSLLTTTLGINNKDKVVWWVSAEKTPVRWGDFASFNELVHHLYVVHCDESKGFLYINSSNNDSLHDDIAEAIGGEGVQLLSGDQVYRVLAKINRRVPTNVGLLDAVSRTRRFSMHVGQDVLAAWRGEGGTKMKTNIFAHGFNEGRAESFGASRKGRVWSHQEASDIHDWVSWTRDIGPTITDESIDLKEVMDGFLLPVPAEERPPYVPLAIEWPHEIMGTMSESRTVSIDGESFPLIDTSLELASYEAEGDIVFNVVTPTSQVAYKIVFRKGEPPAFTAIEEDARIQTTKGDQSLGAFLTDHGLFVTFDHEVVLTEGGFLLEPKRDKFLFPSEAIEAFDWKDVNIRRESQGPERDPKTVQFRTIETLASQSDWEVIIDDDGSGELADIVLMRRIDHDLEILFVHCKFSSEDKPGARIGDLYDVCGQAMKMNRAKSVPDLVVKRLLRRETIRQANGRSGLIYGTAETLAVITREAKYRKIQATIAVVQPGMSKGKVSDDMRALLGGTERFLADTYGMKFRVIASV
jgi:superfamily II DNA or RNA helicase